MVTSVPKGGSSFYQLCAEYGAGGGSKIATSGVCAALLLFGGMY